MSSNETTPKRRPRKLEVRSNRASVDWTYAQGQMPGGSGRDDMDAFAQRDNELPTLPIEESSFLKDETPSFVRRSDEPHQVALDSDDIHGMDERAMHRHLMDDESSFLPDAASGPSYGEGEHAGMDDTYVELGQSKQSFSQTKQEESEQEQEEYYSDMESPEEQAEDFDAQDSEGLSDLGDIGSPLSPAEAAAQRSHSRPMSAVTMMPARVQSLSLHSGSNTPSNSRPSTPSAQRPSSKGSTIRPSSPRPEDIELPQSEFASSIDSSDSQPTPSPQRALRPSFMNGRQVSQRSSLSSATLSSDFSGSDTTVGADYALQTGGARPGSNSMRESLRAPNMFDRLPSFGSVSSFLSQDSDSLPTLGRLSGNFSTANRDHLAIQEEPATPRPSTSRHDAPTDTVLAQRVESIQVPETVARDFRARNHMSVADKRPASSDGQTFNIGDRPRKTLTLKEQNGKIDKLTKENFDLKLKIHFLDQALRSHSEEGLQELIDKNVQYQTDLANERKESHALRRKIRELERRIKDQEDALAEAQNAKAAAADEESDDEDPTLQAEMHEEILYLRQQLDYSENQVTSLNEEIMTQKSEKRKMAEHMRSMAGNRAEDTSGVRETVDMWQDLLNAETGRREQAEEDVRQLREELSALKIERASPAISRMEKKAHRGSRMSYATFPDDQSDFTNGVNGSESSATLVEQLKHENSELRRDLGAQTSMLTSRNRERERLQQEIEDLKLLQRKSDGSRSVAGESIFERSISRAHQRAPSRGSEQTALTEAERDEWERKEGQLRDHNAELRLKYQELERTHNTHLQYVTALEGDFQEMEQELNDVNDDLKSLAAERDDALQNTENMQSEYAKLEQEAVAEIDKLEKELESLDAQLQDAHKKSSKIQAKLEHTTDGYKGLQGELREITQSVMNLEDEKQANVRTIETLEQQINEAEDEINKWEQKCKELDQKNRKLEITQESLHSEITFLREEQEGDKIKIGELEDTLNAAHQTIQDEQEKQREMEEQMVEEHHQRDVLENKSKEEVQSVLDGLNAETAKTRDEVRKLRRVLSAKEVEASSWKQKLEELEQDLRHILGDLNGTKVSILGDIEKLQRDVEQTANALDRAKMDLADKDRLLRHRDGLLESTSLESRRLSDLLDKERAARKHDLDQFERASRGQATNMRTIAHHESRVLELETAYSHDKRKMAALEQQYRDQLLERNTLLLALWNRLSTLCGADWAQNHSLVNGEVPSTEVIARSLTGFNKNIISAVKTIEALIGSFKVRVRSVEKDLWKDYQTLEHNLEMRIRRMDVIERAVKDTQTRIAEDAASEAQRPQASRQASSRSIKGTDEIAKLKAETKMLKNELKFHRQHPSAMAQQMLNQQAQMHPDNLRRSSTNGSSSAKPPSPARAIVAQLLRHHSTSAVEQLQGGSGPAEDMGTGGQSGRVQSIVLASPPIQPTEQRWIHRLKELERRLKAEREARLLDRRGARQRLEEGRQENEELRQMLEREKVRRESLAGSEMGDRAAGGEFD